jgi:plasmid stability protein
MAQLIVRNLDAEIVQRLKELAASNGRSAEAEHREILRRALMGTRGHRPSLKVLLASMPEVGEDRDFERPRDLGREVDL